MAGRPAGPGPSGGSGGGGGGNGGPTASPGGGGGGGGGYFVDSRKGEVNELRTLLRSAATERDKNRRREVIRKVVAYHTLGVDVSRLLPEMVLAVETRDIVTKKMVLGFITYYAHTQPQMSLMCINTIQRDCNNEDPMVRGLALRALCSLRLPDIVEYLSEPLRKSLTDISPYVRKTGVVGILKLFHMQPKVVRESNMVETLYNMLMDVDASVVCNCIMALDEILADEGGMAVNQALLFHLLNRVPDLNEWGLCQVLDLVARYDPETEEETFNVMNLLDPVLRTTNSGAVLATVKCFLHLTRNMEDLQPQVYERIKAPLLTLLAAGSHETNFALLKHLENMVKRCPGVFDDEFRQFFVRYNEPSYVKYVKIAILPYLANDQNVGDLVEELVEYVSDVDVTASRKAIAALGRVAFRLPQLACTLICERLTYLLELDIDYVQAEAVAALKDLLRRFPDARESLLPSMPLLVRKVEDSTARASLVWILGEFGEEIREAPYLLERMIDTYEEETSVELKLQILTSAMKIFLKRPPEMHAMLGRLLTGASNDTSNQDVHDRALLYIRLLQRGPEVAQTVINSAGNDHSPHDLVDFAEERDDDRKNKVFSEFNTLAIVYDKPSEQFIDARHRRSTRTSGQRVTSPTTTGTNPGAGTAADGAAAAAAAAAAVPPPVAAETDLLGVGDDDETAAAVPPPAPAPASAPATQASAAAEPVANGGGSSAIDDILGIMDNAMGSGGAGGAGNGSALLPLQTMSMDSKAFQERWGQLTDAISNGAVGTLASTTTVAAVEAHLRGNNVFTMASGDLPDLMKFFFYALDAQGNTHLAMCVVNKADMNMSATVRSDVSNSSATPGVAANLFVDHLRGLLSQFMA